jgi:hypothetical protein
MLFLNIRDADHLLAGWHAPAISSVSGARLKTAQSAQSELNCHCPYP